MYVEKYPDPGECPPKPGPEPPYYNETPLLNDPNPHQRSEAHDLWQLAADKYNEWIGKKRRFIVAEALDELLEQPSQKKKQKMRTPVERIAVAMGLAFLDGGGMPKSFLGFPI